MRPAGGALLFLLYYFRNTMTTKDDSEDSFNINNAIIVLIVFVGFCICGVLALCLWRRQREKTVDKKVKVRAQLAEVDHSTRTPRRRDEPKRLATKNEQMVPYLNGWPAVARRDSGNRRMDFPYMEDEDFKDPQSRVHLHNHETFLGAILQRQSSEGALSCEWEVEEYRKMLIREDVTSTSSSDSNTNHYPSIVNPNYDDCSIKIDGITKGKLFAERPTSSATAGNDGCSETTGTFPSSIRPVGREDGRFQPPALHISLSGSSPMFDPRFDFWPHDEKSKLFNIECFSPMNKDDEHSFEVPDRPQSRRSKKSEETQGSNVRRSRSWLDEETDTSLSTAQSVFLMKSSRSRTGYSFTSKASGTGISVISESLRPVPRNEEDFSEDRQYKHAEDGQYKRSDDASSNPQSRRANEEAHNGRTSWEPDHSIVLSSPDHWRNRNNKGLSIPHRQSNEWLNRQGENSIEKLSATKSDHLIIPSNYRRKGFPELFKKNIEAAVFQIAGYS